MARFDTSGLDSVLAKLQQMGELTGTVAQEMLTAGAEIVKNEWRESAERHGHRDTGNMIDSIGYPKRVQNANDVLYVDIYPQGKDAKGVRNAEKAFILNYGTSKKPASHWIDDADGRSGPLVAAEFERIFNERFGKG